MKSSVPQTAMRGRSYSPHDRFATGLGYFSLLLGMAELLAPRAVCQAAGLDGQEKLIQAYGAREVVTGVALLASHDPTPWVWGRVVGDAADIATAATGLHPDNPRRNNTILTLAALVAVTAVDVLCGTGLRGEKGDRRTAVTDYSSRSGFPRGVDAARGAAARAG